MPFVIRRRRGASNEEVLRQIIPDFKKQFYIFAALALILIVVLSGLSSTGPWWLAEERRLRFSFEFLGTPFDFLITTLVAFASYSISHGFSYTRNFIAKEEYRKITLREQLKAPLDRLGVMWGGILFGSFLAVPFQSSVAALVFLIFLKTAFDIHAHIKEHTKLAKHPLSCEKFWET